MRLRTSLLILLLLLTMVAPHSARAAADLRCRTDEWNTSGVEVVENGVLVREEARIGVIDLADCATIWEYESDYRILDAAAADGSIAFIEADWNKEAMPTWLVLLDLETGASRWSVRIATESDEVVTGGGVTAAKGTQELVAYENKTGEEVWSRSFDYAELGAFNTEDAVHLLISAGGVDDPSIRLVQIELASGKDNWSRSFDGAWYGSVAALEAKTMIVEMLHVSDEYFDIVTYNLDPATGETRWDEATGFKYTLGLEDTFGLRLAYDDLEDESGYLEGFDAVTGASLWTYESKLSPYQVVLAGDRVVYAGYEIRQGNDREALTALDSESGERLWSIRIGAGVLGMKVSDTTIYLVNGDYLWAVSLKTGKQKWQSYLAAYPYGDDVMVLMDDALVITNQNGYVLIYNI